MAEHTVKAFDVEMGSLRGLIAEMGGLAELAIGESIDALIKGSEELAQGLVAVKSLRDGAGAQRTESLSTVAHWALSLQSTL